MIRIQTEELLKVLLRVALNYPVGPILIDVLYLGKFMSLVRDRRKQEVKEVYQDWTDRVVKGYSQEHLE